MTYSIWKNTSGVTAYSFTSTYHETTDIFGTAGLSNGHYVLIDRAENSTEDVVQTMYFGGAVVFENDIIGDAPDSGDDLYAMVVSFDGGYAIGWELKPTGSEASDIYLAVYGNDGVQIGSDIHIDAGHAQGDVELNGIATNSSGLISVLWSDASISTDYESIVGTGEAPVTEGFTRSFVEDEFYAFKASDFLFVDAVDTTPTTIKIYMLPTSGALKLDGVAVSEDQVIPFADISKLTWTPNANDWGRDFGGIYFQVGDSAGNFSQLAEVRFNIEAVPDMPVTADIHFDVDQNKSFSFKKSDFAYSDGDDDSAYYIIINSLAGSGKLTFKGAAVEVGDEIDMSALAKLVYTAPKTVGNNLASYGFEIVDSAGDHSTAHTISIDVNKANNAPVAKNDTATAYVDKALKIDVLGNDADKDGDSMTITKATLEKGAPGEVTIKNGQLVYDSGNVKSLGHGERESFDITYTISDGANTDKAVVSVILLHEEDVFGTNSADKIGDKGSSKFYYGLGGDDVLITTSDNVNIFGGDGKDKIYYNNGFGSAHGGDGNDVIVFNKRGSVAYGDNGDDKIIGGLSKDMLYGGSGNDRLKGGHGDDELSGGKGTDIFEYNRGDGVDKIIDFEATGRDGDKLMISGFGKNFDFESIVVTKSGKSTVLDFGSDNELYLLNVRAQDIDASDFIF